MSKLFTDKIIKELSKKYQLSEKEIKLVVDAPFHLLKTKMNEIKFNSKEKESFILRIIKLGTFKVNDYLYDKKFNKINNENS